MTADLGLSTLLSQTLVGFTIEFDNEFEYQMPHTTARGPAAHSRRGPWLVSMAMWSNFLQYLGPGGLPSRDVAGMARLTNLPGLLRWGYVVEVGDTIRPTPAGQRAQEVWRPLEEVIEHRWRQRFAEDSLRSLRDALTALRRRIDLPLPEYLPVLWTGKAAEKLDEWSPVAGTAGRPEAGLATLMAQVLLAYALEFERDSAVSLPIAANALRVLGDEPTPTRDLPAQAGVSKEAISMSVNHLDKLGLIVVGPDPKTARGQAVRLTPRGQATQDEHSRLLTLVERRWRARFGAVAVNDLRAALLGVLDQRQGAQLAEGMRPYPDGWRAHPPYRNLTNAMLDNPRAALPHYPMVSHRGGFPDGS